MSRTRREAAVPAELFTPPPKVDSAVVTLKLKPLPSISKDQEKRFFRIVKAGFSAKRKKLRSSIAGGLALSKDHVEAYLRQADIDPEARAESLSVEDWVKLASTGIVEKV